MPGELVETTWRAGLQSEMGAEEVVVPPQVVGILAVTYPPPVDLERPVQPGSGEDC